MLRVEFDFTLDDICYFSENSEITLSYFLDEISTANPSTINPPYKYFAFGLPVSAATGPSFSLHKTPVSQHARIFELLAQMYAQ